jgi:DNA-binding NarL/FixJ family response regulator
MTPDHGLPPTRLVIADDRPRTRRALRALLATQPGVEVIGEAADGVEAVAMLERHRPDVVLLDVQMPRLDGVAATARIKARWPSVRVVCLSMVAERREEALAAGADAFVCKGAATAELLAALRPLSDAP